MENQLVISANGPWYDLFYNLAFLLTISILIYEGYRRKFPMLKWIFLLVVTRLLFIAGTKLVTISPNDWFILFTQFRLPEANDKSLAGGFLFGGIALFSGIGLLRFKQNVTDAFAFVIPLGIAIQRVGCFITGCCYGKISSLPWAVKYPAQTLPHFHQFSDKLLTFNDFVSLPVHPVQLYEMAGMLAVFIVLLKFRKTFKRSGNLFLFSISMVFLVRFITEFFRDIHAHTIGGAAIWIFNTTQLVLLPITFLLIFILIKREKNILPSIQRIHENDFGIAHAFFMLLLVSILFRVLKSWFVFSEIVAISLTLLIAFSILFYRILKYTYVSPYRWLYLASSVIPFLLMAQTFPFEKDSTLIKKYKTIKIGMATGDFENEYTLGSGSGCGRINNTEYFQQKYTVGAAALEFTEEKPEERLRMSYGAKVMMGTQNEIRISDRFETNKTLFGVTPYINWDSNWLGIGGGLHLGNLSYVYENLNKDGEGRPESGSNWIPVYPQIYFRLGPQKWFFVDYHLADQFPSALPGYRQLLGIGTGLGRANGTNLRFGSNLGGHTYVSGSFVIADKVVLEPFYMWGKSPYHLNNENFTVNNEIFSQFSLGISYRFEFRDVKKLSEYSLDRTYKSNIKY